MLLGVVPLYLEKLLLTFIDSQCHEVQSTDVALLYLQSGNSC